MVIEKHLFGPKYLYIGVKMHPIVFSLISTLIAVQAIANPSETSTLTYQTQRPSNCHTLVLEAQNTKNLTDLQKNNLLKCFAPVIKKDIEKNFDRLGTPEVTAFEAEDFKKNCSHHSEAKEALLKRSSDTGADLFECVSVSSKKATVFSEAMEVQVRHPENKSLVDAINLVYRLSFQKTEYPFSIYKILNYAENHHNSGVFLIITLDRNSLKPLYLSSLLGCGCYFSATALGGGDAWPFGKTEVHGYQIPNQIDLSAFSENELPIFQFELSSLGHRVKNVGLLKQSLNESKLYALKNMEELDQLPVYLFDGNLNRKLKTSWKSSYFYLEDHGKSLQGLVRGAYNFWENKVNYILAAGDWSLGWDRRLTPKYQGDAKLFSVTLSQKHREDAYFENFDNVISLYEKLCINSDNRKCGL
ncbi:MAG: hypothetical protein AB7F64_08450 [Gammaproteobacteria bacterium]